MIAPSALNARAARFAPSPARAHGLAESVRVQQARSCRGGDQPLQTCDRRCTALAHGPTSGDRSGDCGRGPELYAGAGTPELCPHRLKPDRDGVTAPAPLIHATRSQLAQLWIEIYGGADAASATARAL